jgi:hypothetical protein
MGKGKIKSDIEKSKGDIGNYIEIRYKNQQIETKLQFTTLQAKLH